MTSLMYAPTTNLYPPHWIILQRKSGLLFHLQLEFYIPKTVVLTQDCFAPQGTLGTQGRVCGATGIQ